MMENISKAIDIAGGILLFVFAITVSAFLYSQIINYTKDNFLISDLNNRTAIALDDKNYESMSVSRAEMIMTLININELEINEIIVYSSSGVNYSIKPNSSGAEADKDYFMVSGSKKEISTYNFLNIESRKSAKFSMSYKNSVLTFINI